MRTLAALAVALAVAPGGCATFEDPTIVLDLRVIGMTAEPPEQVIELDLSKPPRPDELIAQLDPTYVCAYLADPAERRALWWSMTACLLDLDSRCDPARPQVFLGEGVLGDPEQTPEGGRACSLIEYDADPAAWIAMLGSAIEGDPTRGLGGVDYAVELRVGEELASRALDLFGVKQARISARIPDTRVANHNPTLADLQLSRASGFSSSAPRRRCADPSGDPVFSVRSGEVITLYPLEPEEGIDPPVREEFIVPTLDGGFEKYTEVLTYQWLGGGGTVVDPLTGGPPDVFGNQTLLGTDWIAPTVGQATLIPIWVIQRDERFGGSVRETCIRVLP